MEKGLSSNYKGRCGNCHSIMRPDDKYCRYCGTPKGEGEFLPYQNKVYCVYGPPIKEVFRCHACGHRWAVVSLRENVSKYCPQCRSEQLEMERKERKRFGEFIGTDLSENLSEGYQFLSEEEVIRLLDLRSDQKEDNKETAKRIEKYGFVDWEIAEARKKELTEKEAERANLERTILKDLTGTDPTAMHKKCPVCKGKMIAGIRYKNIDFQSGEEKYIELGYSDLDGDGIYYDSRVCWREQNDNPQYKCLQCGYKFI